MRNHISLTILLTATTVVSCAANAYPPTARTALRVVLYPFLPAKDAYFRQIETAFEAKNPGIDLQVVDLSTNYYDEGSPDAVTNTASDVFELDSVFLDDFVAAGKVRELPGGLLRPAGTFVSTAERAVIVKGKRFGLPHWVCSNFLFSSDSDPFTPATFADLMGEIGDAHKPDRGLLIDLKGRSTLGEWYLDSLLDRHKSLAAALPYLDEAMADKAVYADLTAARALCDSDLCRQGQYHDAAGFYPVQLARHHGRALAGYSERLYYLGMEEMNHCKKGECIALDQIRISSLPLSNNGSQPFAWVDSFVISNSCSGTCLKAAEAFVGFMSDPVNVRASLMPGFGEAPRYLLPALKSLYTDSELHDKAPLYEKFYPLIENAIPVRAAHLNQQLRAIGSTLDKSVIPK